MVMVSFLLQFDGTSAITTVPTVASACLLQVPFNMSTSGMVFPCDELQNRCGTDGHGLKLCTLYLPVAGAPRGAT